jgi:hypothetical protein
LKIVDGNKLLSTHCYLHGKSLASRKLAPELNEVFSQSIKIINYSNTILQIQDCQKHCAMKWDLMIKIFSGRNFVECAAVNLKRLYQLRKEVEMFLIDMKSQVGVSQRHISLHIPVEFKTAWSIYTYNDI